MDSGTLLTRLFCNVAGMPPPRQLLSLDAGCQWRDEEL